ncbi:cyclic nucleotide-gated ion channel 1-like isoform X3 [Castanea sativa]|uniref:cyclic nucleotide-gated ion channel 1-like isoform X3 n=1 Tax=Castanea sativa TaxID=21020 RepID=UPI003F650C77
MLLEFVIRDQNSYLFFVKLVGLCKHSSEIGSLFWRLDHRQALGMNYLSPSQDNDKRSLVGYENKDTEGQSRQRKVVEIVSKSTFVGSQKKKSTFEALVGLFLKWYEEILVFFRAIAVSLDPLFFYVPVIKEDKKCIELNKVLWTIAIVSRSVTDAVYLVHFVVKSYMKRGSKANTTCWENGRRHLFSIMFNVLVILPIPQVVMPSIFSEMRRTKSSSTTILNSVILLQYGPRVFQIYRYWKELKRAEKSNKASQWITASLNLFLYILAGHVLGAFWYFFSTQRLAACWHKAREIHSDGVEISFNCDHSFRKLSFLDDFCPIDPPNPSTFDFGIFLEARRSGSLESTGFLPKAFYCFWWGMRNLSSFGSNLQTSSYIWENIFALGISIFGLLLFLYFIGNLQLEIIKDSGLAGHHQLLLKICDSLKPMFYNEHCYIVREGDPIDAVFFITDGIVWTSTSNNGEGSNSRRAERLERGQHFGEELLEWVMKPTSDDMRNLSILPVSSKTLKTHTKVEAFALMAHDFNKIWQLSLLGPEQLFQAAVLIQQFWRRKRLRSQQGWCWWFKKTCFDV